jgi:16S rRNA (guanine(966)-N(2))-methyltransferase RsmD
MRVIAGIYRSRPLATLRGAKLRPTSDRLRETLFNILGSAVHGSVFVDLFAGTGAVGIEALSRGARSAYFIESHRAAVALIRKNLSSLAISEGAEVMATDARRGLRALVRSGTRADFVFLDPPYAKSDEYVEVLELLATAPLLAESGLAIAEHARRLALPERLERLTRVRLVEQGDAALSFYRQELPVL